MAININSNFKVGSPEPLDTRMVLTMEQMLSMDDAVMPDKYLAVGQEDGQLYIYNKDNEKDAKTGKFRIFESGGGVVEVDDLPNPPKLNVYVTAKEDGYTKDYSSLLNGDDDSSYRAASFMLENRQGHTVVQFEDGGIIDLDYLSPSSDWVASTSSSYPATYYYNMDGNTTSSKPKAFPAASVIARTTDTTITGAKKTLFTLTIFSNKKQNFTITSTKNIYYMVEGIHPAGKTVTINPLCESYYDSATDTTYSLAEDFKTSLWEYKAATRTATNISSVSLRFPTVLSESEYVVDDREMRAWVRDVELATKEYVDEHSGSSIEQFIGTMEEWDEIEYEEKEKYINHEVIFTDEDNLGVYIYTEYGDLKRVGIADAVVDVKDELPRTLSTRIYNLDRNTGEHKVLTGTLEIGTVDIISSTTPDSVATDIANIEALFEQLEVEYEKEVGYSSELPILYYLSNKGTFNVVGQLNTSTIQLRHQSYDNRWYWACLTSSATYSFKQTNQVRYDFYVHEQKVFSKNIELATKKYVDEQTSGDGYMPIEGNTQKDNFNLNVNNFNGDKTGGESIISAQPDALTIKHHHSEENDWLNNISSQVELKEDNITITLSNFDRDSSGNWDGETKITPKEFSIQGRGYDDLTDYADYEFTVGMQGVTINGRHDGDGFYLDANSSKTQILHENAWSDGDYHIANGLKLDSSGVDIVAEDYDDDEEDYVTGTLHVGPYKATYKDKEIVTKDNSDTIHITNLNGTGEENEYIQITANGEEGALIRMTGRSGIVTIGGQNIDLNSSLRPTWDGTGLATLDDLPDMTTKVSKSGDTMTGTLTLAGTSMPLASGTVTGMTDGTTQLFKDGIAISNPETRNDVGWIRVTGTDETDTIMEIATGDDGGAGEMIVFRGYNTSNEVAYQVDVPKDTGTLALTKNVLGTGGGTITGPISRDSGGSWISGRDNATVKQTKQTTNEGSSWNPVVSVKTAAGNWTIGNVGGENLGFSYDTDENYAAGRNTNTVFYLTPNGTFTGTSGAETGYKVPSRDVSGGLHIPMYSSENYVLRGYCQTMTGYTYVKNGNHVSMWLQVPRLRSYAGDASYTYTLPFNFKRGFIMGLTDPLHVKQNRRSVHGGDCTNSEFADTFTGQYVYMYAEYASWSEAQDYGLNREAYSLSWYRGWDVILIEGEV